jgi:hypothetical protein
MDSSKTLNQLSSILNYAAFIERLEQFADEQLEILLANLKTNMVPTEITEAGLSTKDAAEAVEWFLQSRRAKWHGSEKKPLINNGAFLKQLETYSDMGLQLMSEGLKKQDPKYVVYGDMTAKESAEIIDNVLESRKAKAHGADIYEPKPIKNDGPDIAMLVIEDMKARRIAGIKKHGGPLQPNNGRYSLMDAYQECLDLCNYIRQKIEEEEHETIVITAQKLYDNSDLPVLPIDDEYVKDQLILLIGKEVLKQYRSEWSESRGSDLDTTKFQLKVYITKKENTNGNSNVK